ncbi:MAG: hypothetical protein ABH821_05330 [archaeon]
MGIEEAVEFARKTEAELVIPMHYDSPNYPASPEEFKEKALRLNVKIMKNKEEIEVI